MVKPSPSRTPYPAAATGIGIELRQPTGSWRRTCGTIGTPRASAIAAATATSAASAYATVPAAAPTSSPNRASAPKVIAPPRTAKGPNVIEAASVVGSPPS